MLDITRRVSAEPVPSAETLEHDLASDADTLFLLASRGVKAVGTGVGKRSSIPGCLYAMARVVPERRRSGIGTALYAALSEHARRIGLRELVGRVHDGDHDSLDFVRKRGFREISRECRVALELAGAGDPSTPPPGVEIVSLADRPDLVRSAYGVERESVPDIPAEEHLVPRPFEKWFAETLDGPGALPAGTFVALAEGDVVGYAGLTALDGTPRTAENLLTAVRGRWRGRGIATALKRAQIAWAREAGFERIVTSNDEANAPMRAVNAKLGYRPEPDSILLRGPLA